MDSVTETYVAVEFYVNNWRWADVPFYIRTGKRLPRQASEIRVHFKRTPQALFASTPYEQLGPNVITLRIQPDDGISIAFDVKRPGQSDARAYRGCQFLLRDCLRLQRAARVRNPAARFDAWRSDFVHAPRRSGS